MKIMLRLIKRFITAFTVSFIISAIIYRINRDFGNDIPPCFEISFFLFLNIFAGFLAYFYIRDIYSKRWNHVQIDRSRLKRRFVRFPIDAIKNGDLNENQQQKLQNFLSSHELKDSSFDQGQLDLFNQNWRKNGLYSEIIFPLDSESMKTSDTKKELIIFCHGFANSSKEVRHYTYALGLSGYTVFSYDARGAGKSTKLGRKRSFLSRNHDLSKIINYFSHHLIYQNYKINIIGESMGGISAISSWSFQENLINKIIVISIPSIFNKIMKRHMFPLSKKWIVRLNYRLKGISVYPPEKINEQLSPYLILAKMKQQLLSSSKNPMNQTENDKWKEFTNSKVLLIHSLSDHLFKIKNFEQNKEILNLSPENSLLFSDGGHNQIKNEPAILSTILNFLRK